MENIKQTAQQKRITLELAVDNEQGDPIETKILVAYHPYHKGDVFISYPTQGDFSSNVLQNSPLLMLLSDNEIRTINSPKISEKRIWSQIGQIVKSLRGDHDELMRRFAYHNYKINLGSLTSFVTNKEGKDDDITLMRKCSYKHDDITRNNLEDSIRMFYVARYCASLCNQPFNMQRAEIDAALCRAYGEKAKYYMKDIDEVLKISKNLYCQSKEVLAESHQKITEYALKGNLDMREINTWKRQTWEKRKDRKMLRIDDETNTSISFRKT